MMKINKLDFEQLTIVVVTYQSMAVMPIFLEALETVLAGRDCRVLICDNASDDGLKAFVHASDWSNVTLLESDVNEGFGAGLNRGIAAATTDYVVLMNPDVVIQAGCLEKLMGFLEAHPNAAGISSRVQAASSLDDVAWQTESYQKPVEVRLHQGFESIWTRIMFYSGLQTKFPKVSAFVPWSTVPAQGCVQVSRFHGCFGMFRRKDLVGIGQFDPRFFLFFEEDDLGRRFLAAHKTLHVDCDTAVFHLSGQGSRESGSNQVNQILLNSQYMFFRKHFGLLNACLSFALVWLTLSMVLSYQYCFTKTSIEHYKMLWHWHWQCLKMKGKTPKGTIPAACVARQNYNWKDIKVDE